MSESRCNCTRPNTRGKGKACPIHKTIPEESIVELGNPVRESTPNTEQDEPDEEEPFPINFEDMDELLTQLAADRQATNTRMETLLKDNRKVRLKEPKEFKGEEGWLRCKPGHILLLARKQNSQGSQSVSQTF